jgi:hypothetical protein
MIGKKDTKCIFEQYRQVLKEQVEDNKINALLNAVKSSNLDPKFRDSLIALLKDPEVISKWKGGDADTVNAGDSNFAKEMAAAQKAQNLAYPEQNEEEPMPTEAPWWIPGEANKERWLGTQQGHWRQAQREKQAKKEKKY